MAETVNSAALKSCRIPRPGGALPGPAPGPSPFLLRLSALALCVLLPLALCTSCRDTQNRKELARRMAEQEQGSSDAVDMPPVNSKRIAELKTRIRRTEKAVEQTLRSVKDRGTYWRLLALKYMDYQMWAEALKAFDEALLIYPDFANLHYNRALCASQLALSLPEPEERYALFLQSESGYRRALAANPRHAASMYALSVLLVFELERSAEARPLLENYLDIERSSMEARFLLARVYLEEGLRPEALKLYEDIERMAPKGEEREKARQLYTQVAGGAYGS